MNELAGRRNPVEMLAEDFAKRLREGGHPDTAEYLARCPAYAREVSELFPIIEMLEGSRRRDKVAADAADSGSLSLMLLGDYCLVREIGRGGMGVVYEAKQRSLDRTVALKVLPANHLPSPKHVLRFKQEAQAAARLHHTNIVPVFGVGEHEGTHYFVMQYIDGCGLDALIHELQVRRNPETQTAATRNGHRHRNLAGEIATWLQTRPLRDENAATQHHAGTKPSAGRASSGSQPSAPSAATHRPTDGDKPGWLRTLLGRRRKDPFWSNVAQVGLQAARALAYAHSQGVAHRDVKPSNLMIDVDGTVWLTDFGLAKSSGQPALTDSRDAVGTLRYMAPEQFTGRYDVRSDVYALGLTLYELATWRPAFGDENQIRLMDRITQKSPPTPRSIDPAVPRNLETIILKAMAREPERRYQSADDMAEDLERFLSGRAILARKTTLVERAWRWCDRNSAVARLACACTVCVLAISVVATIAYVRTTEALAAAATERANSVQARAELSQARQTFQQELLRAEDRILELERTSREKPATKSGLRQDAGPVLSREGRL